jgi:hypothetical protein
LSAGVPVIVVFSRGFDCVLVNASVSVDVISITAKKPATIIPLIFVFTQTSPFT